MALRVRHLFPIPPLLMLIIMTYITGDKIGQLSSMFLTLKMFCDPEPPKTLSIGCLLCTVIRLER